MHAIDGNLRENADQWRGWETKMKIHFSVSDSPEAKAKSEDLIAQYGHHDADDCDVIVALGGDGQMLQALKTTFDNGKPVYGLHCGTVGFLMNDMLEETTAQHLVSRIKAAEETIIHPLSMQVTTVDGKTHQAHGINEVSLLRESHQTARIAIVVDGVSRMEELICDGVLLATPAGSTAYNLSAHGPIIPLKSSVMALTPISAFRPRRWRGALLPNNAAVEFIVHNPQHRPVSASADSIEFRDVARVVAKEDKDISLRILSDPGHGLEERVMREQFVY